MQANASEDQREMLKELRLAYIQFSSHFARSPFFQWEAVHHRCTDRCAFFDYCHTRICVASGSWHYCTDLMCDRKVTTKQHQVCELSGNIFELDFQFTFGLAQGADHDQIGGADDAVMAHEEADYDYEDHPADAENDTSRRLKTHIKVFKDSSSTQKSTSLRQAYTGSKRIEEQAAPAECLQTERSQKRQLTVELQSATLDDSLELSSESAAAIQSAPKKKRNTRRSEIEPRRVIFNNTLNTVFGEAVVRNNRSMFGSILENVERLWCLVHSDQELHTRHVEVTHLVAILETMKIGYEPKGLPIIPCHAWIRDKMSEIRHIEAIHAEIKNSRVTATVKNFNEVFTRLLKRKEHIDNGFTNLVWQ